MSTLFSLGQRPWRRISSVAEGASVFVDDEAAEILHWSEPASQEDGLLNVSLGVYSLYTDLNHIAKDFIAQAPYCHVVIVSTKPLIGRCAERIAALLSDIQPLECHVFCALSESMHEEYTPLKGGGAGGDQGGSGYSHYGEFQAMMKKWIKRESGVRVTVSHVDLFHVEILPNVFCTPVYHDTLFSLTPSDIPLLQKNIDEIDPDCSLDSLYDIQFNYLPQSYQKSLTSFVQSFNSLLQSMDLQEDIFSIGPTSRLLADQLSTSEESRVRRKSASRKCSVLFVDRTLDLATPCSRSPDYIIDRMFSQLPPLNTGSNDSAVSMAPLSQVDPRYVVPGCLAHPGSSKARSIMSSLTFSKQKEALMDLSRSMLEVLSKEKLSSRSISKMGKSPAAQVRGFLELFQNHPEVIMKNSELLQMACGVVEVMEQAVSKHWDQLCKEEQKVMQSLLKGDTVVKYIVSLVQSQLEGSLAESKQVCVADVICLIVEFYSLIGEDCYNHHVEETTLKESLANLMLMRRACDIQFLTSIGITPSSCRLEVMSRLESMFSCYNSLGTVRDNLTAHLRDVFTPDADTHIHPFITLLLESICDLARPDLPDIRHHAQGLTNIIRSSFSLFMSSARPRPDAHPLLVVFVIGGVSVEEIRALNNFITVNKPSMEIYLGSNKLLTPQRTIGDLMMKEKRLINQ